MIQSRTHGIIDYLTGVLLLASPWLFNFSVDTLATTTICVMGVIIVVYSLITRYELSIARIIPFRVHLLLDVLSAFLLITAPWIYGYIENAKWTFVGIGVFELIVVFLTKRSVVQMKQQTNIAMKEKVI